MKNVSYLHHNGLLILAERSSNLVFLMKIVNRNRTEIKKLIICFVFCSNVSKLKEFRYISYFGITVCHFIFSVVIIVDFQV